MWIIYSLVPLREEIYHSYTPLIIVQEYIQVEYINIIIMYVGHTKYIMLSMALWTLV